MKNPKNNKQEILLTLISNGRVSIFDYSYMSGFRTRISELIREHNLPLEKVQKISHNKYGRAYHYIEHRLAKENVKQAVQLYESI